MKYSVTFFLISLVYSTTFSQVSKKIVVEHFTNTLCSICATKNPGFYTNLNNNEGILHLAIHPSSPYSACLLNQNNVEENDDRTNFYGLYGGTPRIVIQGTAISPAEDYSDESLFDPFKDQVSPASIRFEQTKFNTDSIQCNIIIKTEAENTLGDLLLFVALAEDTLFYSSPNGEDQHYDVFRKSMFSADGITVNLPSEVGDSIILSTSAALNFAWNSDRIYSIAILQESGSKEVVQSEASDVFIDSLVEATSIDNLNEPFSLTIFPNPVIDDLLLIKTSENLVNTLLLFDLNGKLFYSTTFKNQHSLSLENFAQGEYLLKVINEKGVIDRKFVKF